MKFRKIIYVMRDCKDASALIEGNVRLDNGKRFVSDFNSDLVLTDSEVDLAHEELCDMARSYPESGR